MNWNRLFYDDLGNSPLANWLRAHKPTHVHAMSMIRERRAIEAARKQRKRARKG